MRVEIVKEINNSLAEQMGAGDYLERIHQGAAVPVSMGCRVPWDECTICLNHAKTRAQYCSHLKNQMLSYLPDGRQVFAINWYPRFFDISRVRKPADSIAYGLMKVAQAKGSTILSADLADLYPPVKIADDKEAEIKKEIPASDTKIDTTPYKSLIASEKTLPIEVLRSMARFPMRKTLASSGLCGLPLSPREFQYLALCGSGSQGLAESLHGSNKVFSPCSQVTRLPSLSVSDIIPSIVEKILPFLSDRTIAEPRIRLRIVKITKMAPTENTGTEVTELPKVASAYNGYLLSLLEKTGEPVVGTSVVPGVSEATYNEDLLYNKFAGVESLISPLSFGVGSAIYLLTRLVQNAEGRAEAENLLQKITTDPRLAGMLGMALTRAAAGKMLAR